MKQLLRHGRCCLALAALMLALPAQAAYELAPLAERIPESAFGERYATRQWSLASDINETGHLFGYLLTAEGQVRSFNLAFADNPAMTVVDTPDFIALSGADAVCVWVFCTTEYAFGIRLTEAGGLTSFVGAEPGTTPLPGTLPFAYQPGDFVEENRAGVIASTQMDAEGKTFGAVLQADSVITFGDVPWLMDLNDASEPLVLGYDGADGLCQIYGIGCDEAPEDCEDDRHRHTTGAGHQSHGRGHGYGHHCDSPDSMGAEAAAPEDGGALALHLGAEGVARLRFPRQVPDRGLTASSLFPLALNQAWILLRGNLAGPDQNYEGRLLLCRYDPAQPDANADKVVDCDGGLALAEPLAEGHTIRTVLGFSLTDRNQVLGNFGFTAAGIGLPLYLELGSGAPAQLLANRVSSPTPTELSVVTAANNRGDLVGYGYPDCGQSVEAIYGVPAEAPVSDLGFRYPDSIPTTWAQPGGSYLLTPAGQGGSGNYLYRYWRWASEETDWELVQDWSALPYNGTAPASPQETCLRMDLADSLNMADQRSLVIRMRFTDQPEPNSGPDETLVPASVLPTRIASAVEDVVGIGASSLLCLLALLGTGRRRP